MDADSRVGIAVAHDAQAVVVEGFDLVHVERGAVGLVE